MGRKGRPAKAGGRTKGGRLKRDSYAMPAFDKGSEWVQSMREKYQTHYNTALGRAYAAGLLGEDPIANDRYIGGKRFARVYNRVCQGETYRSPLDRTPRGSETEIEAFEDARRDRDWLFAVMDTLDGEGLRPWLDQLIARAHTDHGPPWLDRLLHGGKDPADQMVLKAALKALDVVAPARKDMGIRVERWTDAA
ncbi:hypothetical protein [Novosphingobium sp. KN65.2]|uniref:hypothetical protein n=1 Tax=Novosphingobium sp. KN65.2 TaxID=1478134 RepID=UPI0005E951EF|nr:hypothetical protein [Novosphingobium sp. KN65.2]CDO37132.1 hypothetical protein SPHV1_290005 [Novosphingobium sp. KN65.2]